MTLPLFGASAPPPPFVAPARETPEAIPGALPAPTLAAQARERAQLVAALGMAPEEPTAEGRYAATTGEMLAWAREDRGGELAPGAPRCACGSFARFGLLIELDGARRAEEVCTECWLDVPHEERRSLGTPGCYARDGELAHVVVLPTAAGIGWCIEWRAHLLDPSPEEHQAMLCEVDATARELLPPLAAELYASARPNLDRQPDESGLRVLVF